MLLKRKNYRLIREDWRCVKILPKAKMRKTKTNFSFMQTLAPPVIFMIVSSFHKSCEKQGKQKEEIISRYCATNRPQNKAEANILTNYFFHCFSIANRYSGFCKVSNLSDSVRTAITDKAVGLFHQAYYPSLFCFRQQTAFYWQAVRTIYPAMRIHSRHITTFPQPVKCQHWISSWND